MWRMQLKNETSKALETCWTTVSGCKSNLICERILWELNWLENSSHLMKILLLQLKELFSGCIAAESGWLSIVSKSCVYFLSEPFSHPHRHAIHTCDWTFTFSSICYPTSLLTLYKYHWLVKIQIEGAENVIHSFAGQFSASFAADDGVLRKCPILHAQMCPHSWLLICNNSFINTNA